MLLFLKSLFVAPRLISYTGPTLLATAALTTTASSSSTTASSTAKMGSKEIAIVANGCFWGTEHMFRKHFDNKGVSTFTVGYIGGEKANPSYREVCTGQTNHAEALKMEFDPSLVSYAELIEFHMRMHDPTQVNGQGGDRGTQYRSGIFTTTPEQEVIAKKVVDEVQKVVYPNSKIATIIQPAGRWYDAEDYHQEYLHHNPSGYECPSHYLRKHVDVSHL